MNRGELKCAIYFFKGLVMLKTGEYNNEDMVFCVEQIPNI